MRMQSSTALIGLDIGTTTVCGVLYLLDERSIHEVLIKDNSFISGSEGEYQQDPDSILSDIQRILDALIESSPCEIAAISLSGQMHGILYVDRSGQAVSPLFTWQNQRGLSVSGGSSLEQRISKLLGRPVYTGYGIVTHHSLYHEGLVPSSAKTFCTIADYVCMRLAGKTRPVTDITLGDSMGIIELQTGTIDPRLSRLGIDIETIIPEVVESSHLLGHFRTIPVIQPLGDNQASFLGAVRELQGSILLNYGTAGQISIFSKEHDSFNGFETRPLGNEGFLHAAYSLCGGNSYKILARFFEETARLFMDEPEVSAMQIMDEMGIDPTSKTIECMPLFLGRRGASDQYAYYRGITERNFTPQNLVAATIHGMVGELFQQYEVLPDQVKQRIQYIIGAGNGVRKNLHLQRALEYAYGKPLLLPRSTEESCMGAIINAGKGVGLFDGYVQGAQMVVDYPGLDEMTC